MLGQARAEFYEDRGLVTRERLGFMLTTAAGRWPDRELFLFEGKRYSYSEVDQWAVAVAQDLLARGIKPGDRVAVQLPNSMELIVTQFAIWRIGVISVPIIPLYRQHELRFIFGDSRPTAVVASTDAKQRQPCAEMDEILQELGITPKVRYAVGAGDIPSGWARIPQQPSAAKRISDENFPAPARSTECVLILYTSGTTSAPKGAMLSGGSLLANLITWQKTLGLSEKDVALAGSPVAHVAALSVSVLFPILIGGRTVMLPGWNADAAVKLIEDERITFMAAAAVFLRDLVDRYEAGAGTRHRITTYLSGGAATPPSLVRRADALGIRASRIYGMTETAGACAMARADDPLELRATTDGRIVYGTEVQVVDENRKPLPVGEIGEFRIRSPQMMLTYTDTDITARQLDPDGWFYPGDVGSVDASGWLTMAGRTKDIVNRGGEKFSTQDIEQMLMSHPDVAFAAVVGVPDERLGEVVAAFLQLKAGIAWKGPDEILCFLETAKLAKQKFPVVWRVVNEIPMTATGKVQKQKLLSLPA